MINTNEFHKWGYEMGHLEQLLQAIIRMQQTQETPSVQWFDIFDTYDHNEIVLVLETELFRRRVLGENVQGKYDKKGRVMRHAD